MPYESVGSGTVDGAHPGLRERLLSGGPGAANNFTMRSNASRAYKLLESDDDGGNHLGGSSSTNQTRPAKKKRGSFSGVFVPTCENMWGVLIFLRFFIIVGNAGLFHSLLIVLCSFVVAFCTTACMSAMASSGGIASEGGPYYMISRTIGAYPGVSIGIAYWLGGLLLAVMESVGAIDTLLMLLPKTSAGAVLLPQSLSWLSPFLTPLPLSFALLFVQFLTVFIGGIDAVSKLAVIFIVTVLATVVAFFVSLAVPVFTTGSNYVHGNLWPQYTDGTSFNSMLSLFFPCFTGILSGANRTDVLKNPPVNLKRGTFGAITFSLVMYALFMVLWAAVADAGTLRGAMENGLLYRILLPNAPVVFVGVMISSLSQSLQCLVVAPRLLYSIASDNLLPPLRPIAVLSGKSQEPHRALLVTMIPACLALGILGSSLDSIAPLLTMCFLLCYACINLSCLVQTVLRSVSWRPEGIHTTYGRAWYITSSLLGFIACCGMMLTVHVVFALVVFAICIAVYLYTDYVNEQAAWGSGIDGIRYNLALQTLLAKGNEQSRRVNWRPQPLVIYQAGREGQGDVLLGICSQIRGVSNGMCVVAAIEVGDRTDRHLQEARSAEAALLEHKLTQRKLAGFASVIPSPSMYEGASSAVTITGLGGLRPNTVILAWPEKADGGDLGANAAVEFVKTLEVCRIEQKAVICVKGDSTHSLSQCFLDYFENPSYKEHSKVVDVWWIIHDGGLLALLAWLFTTHEDWVWKTSRVRIFVIMEEITAEQAAAAGQKLENTLRRKRLFQTVEVEVVVLDDKMIEPYTYDWTLRYEERAQFQPTLHKAHTKKNVLPSQLDDLFPDISGNDAYEEQDPQLEASKDSKNSLDELAEKPEPRSANGENTEPMLIDVTQPAGNDRHDLPVINIQDAQRLPPTKPSEDSHQPDVAQPPHRRSSASSLESASYAEGPAVYTEDGRRRSQVYNSIGSIDEAELRRKIAESLRAQGVSISPDREKQLLRSVGSRVLNKRAVMENAGAYDHNSPSMVGPSSMMANPAMFENTCSSDDRRASGPLLDPLLPGSRLPSMVGPTPVPSSAFDGTSHAPSRLMAHKTGQPSFNRLQSQMYLQPPQASAGAPHYDLPPSSNFVPHPIDSKNASTVHSPTAELESPPMVPVEESSGESPTAGSQEESPRESPTSHDDCEHYFYTLNQIILSRSSDSSLVLMNMPSIWSVETDDDCEAFTAYCDCLTQGLQRVLLVASGRDTLLDF
ncbi:hypothetical protein FOL47_000934 [Perkinsus chesapeaki]|uniref:Uncharacterized protein n=1 Tax=Perkinsus chesapeaki TaxID=330153 RepID=A0A7J6N1D8_PERCH|nr:hypothetical protein FOL47_000934 [Perkinsus chesapeaki]